MTKREFQQVVPVTINHKAWGYCDLHFIKFPKGDGRVGVHYRVDGKGSSFATIENTWQKVRDSLIPFLKNEGYI